MQFTRPFARTMATQIKTSNRVAAFGENVFTEFTALAKKLGAVNLGQGFPSYDPPAFATEAAAKAVTTSGGNQYTRMMGHLPLVETLASHYNKLNQFGTKLNAETNFCVTTGATEAGFVTMQALLDADDEVILFEPFYDAYPAWTTMAGGVPKFVPFRYSGSGAADGWQFDVKEIEKLISSKTRAIVVNNPHNPTGKVWSHDELQIIATLAQKHNLVVIADEVYEKIVFPDSPFQHISIASLPGMFDRTITLGSAGKTFSATGWKIGWCIASPCLIKAISLAHQWIPFCVATPLQQATATAYTMAETNGYFTELPEMMAKRRDLLVNGLKDAGLSPIIPHGGYFVVADTQLLNSVFPANAPLRDYQVCKYLTTEVGVTPIPPSAFYSEAHKPLAANFARFALCKDEDMIREACKRLRAAASKFIK